MGSFLSFCVWLCLGGIVDCLLFCVIIVGWVICVFVVYIHVLFCLYCFDFYLIVLFDLLLTVWGFQVVRIVLIVGFGCLLVVCIALDFMMSLCVLDLVAVYFMLVVCFSFWLEPLGFYSFVEVVLFWLIVWLILVYLAVCCF